MRSWREALSAGFPAGGGLDIPQELVKQVGPRQLANNMNEQTQPPSAASLHNHAGAELRQWPPRSFQRAVRPATHTATAGISLHHPPSNSRGWVAGGNPRLWGSAHERGNRPVN